MIQVDSLDNGIKVVLEQMPSVRSVTIGIWVRTGSLYENKMNNGISHFIEHMLFKGTYKRTAKQIAKDMSAIGGHINAFTAKEYTCFYAQTLDENIKEALDVLSDMLQNSIIGEKEILKEKQVILDEIDMYEDVPEDLVHDIFQQSVWKEHALGFNILGLKENINKIDQKDLLTHYKNNYSVDNMVISIAGNFDPNQLKSILNELFMNVKKNETTKKDIEDVNYKQSFITRDKDIEQIHICVGYPSITYNSDELYALALLNTIFGGSMNSRLFQTIREDKALAYSIYSYTSTYQKAGLMNIYVATNPNYVIKVLDEIKNQTQIIKDTLISKEELNQTKEQLKSNYIIGLESTSNRMNNNGKSVLIQDRVKTQDEIIDKLNSVTIEHFMNLTNKIFDNKQMSFSIVGRLNTIEIDRVKDLWNIN